VTTFHFMYNLVFVLYFLHSIFLFRFLYYDRFLYYVVFNILIKLKPIFRIVRKYILKTDVGPVNGWTSTAANKMFLIFDFKHSNTIENILILDWTFLLKILIVQKSIILIFLSRREHTDLFQFLHLFFRIYHSK
jgi:hypothetical protein